MLALILALRGLIFAGNSDFLLSLKTIYSFHWPKFMNTLKQILQSSKVFYGKQITFYDEQINTQSVVIPV